MNRATNPGSSLNPRVGKLLNFSIARHGGSCSPGAAQRPTIWQSREWPLPTDPTGRILLRARLSIRQFWEHVVGLRTMAFQISYVSVDEQGLVDPEDVEAAMRSDTILVSIMMANNETGAIQPIREISRITNSRKVLFHTDAVQAVGKIPVDVMELGVDMLTLSGHKLHGPKGVGALYIRKGVKVEPLVHGGKQENGLRAGYGERARNCRNGQGSRNCRARLHDMERVRRSQRQARGRHTITGAGSNAQRTPGTSPAEHAQYHLAENAR